MYISVSMNSMSYQHSLHWHLWQVSEEFNVAVVLSNQVMADPGGGCAFMPSYPKPVGGAFMPWWIHDGSMESMGWWSHDVSNSHWLMKTEGFKPSPLRGQWWKWWKNGPWILTKRTDLWMMLFQGRTSLPSGNLTQLLIAWPSRTNGNGNSWSEESLKDLHHDYIYIYVYLYIICIYIYNMYIYI